MNNQKSIKLNFIMNAILTMSSFIFPLITFPYVSRILLPEGMGKVAMGTAVVAYFALLARLGIPMYGIRACAEVRDDKMQLSKVVHELFLINLGMTGISYLLFFITVFAVPSFRSEYILYLIMGTTLLFETIGVEWLYKGLEEYSYITYRSIFFKILALAATFLFVHTKADYIKYGAITILAASASNLLNFYNLRKYITFHVFFHYNFKIHVKPILIFFATTCAIVIYTQLNTVMLGLMKTNADVGLYDSAMKIKNILVSVVTALGAVLLPRASYYVKQGLFEEFSRITAKAIHFVCILALPLIAYFMLFATNGIHFLSGKAFDGAILPMQIILPTIFLIGLTNVIGIQVLVPLGKEKEVFYSVFAGGIVDLIACLALIPPLAAIGTAVSNLLAEITVFVVQCYYINKCRTWLDIGKTFRQMQYGKIVSAIAAASVLSYSFRELPWNDFFVLAVSGTVFFMIYGIGLYVLKETFFMELLEPIRNKLLIRNKGSKE